MAYIIKVELAVPALPQALSDKISRVCTTLEITTFHTRFCQHESTLAAERDLNPSGPPQPDALAPNRERAKIKRTVYIWRKSVAIEDKTMKEKIW